MKMIHFAMPLATASLVLAGLTSCSSVTKRTASTASEKACPSAREFITTVAYLRRRTELSLPEPEIRNLAGKVAEGCAGAANRFVQVTELLIRSGVGGPDAVKQGLLLARGSDEQAKVYRRVFQRAFLAENLDLDLATSLRMAAELSRRLAVEPDSVRRDFETLLDYCAGQKGFDLPRQQCGAFAARVAGTGALAKGEIAPEFIRSFEFLRSDRGPGLPLHQALALAEELSPAGPGAAENFASAYRYALSKDGLDSPREAAVSFARQLTRAPGAKPSAQGQGHKSPAAPTGR
jgi:hypothetical protein